MLAEVACISYAYKVLLASLSTNHGNFPACSDAMVACEGSKQNLIHVNRSSHAQ